MGRAFAESLAAFQTPAHSVPAKHNQAMSEAMNKHLVCEEPREVAA